ncbi:hypothetical protein, partial [Paludifilum halophilum]
ILLFRFFKSLILFSFVLPSEFKEKLEGKAMNKASKLHVDTTGRWLNPKDSSEKDSSLNVKNTL